MLILLFLSFVFVYLNKKKVSISACGSLAVFVILEFVSGGPEVSRDNMDYHDISLTLPLRLSVPPRVASCLWGAVSWNQVSVFDCWCVTMLLPLRWLLRNVPSRAFIPKPVSAPPCPPPVATVVTKAEEFTAERIIPNRSADGDKQLFWTFCIVLLLFSHVRCGHTAP